VNSITDENKQNKSKKTEEYGKAEKEENHQPQDWFLAHTINEVAYRYQIRHSKDKS